MFTKYEATVPLYLPEIRNPVHCQLEVDIDDVPSRVKMEFGVPLQIENKLTMLIQQNDLLGMHVGIMRLNEENPGTGGFTPTDEEWALVRKMEDLMPPDLALEWVKDIVQNAERRGARALPPTTPPGL